MISLFGAFVKPFQFTPLREGRRFKCSASLRRRYFNSRPSARGDFSAVGFANALRVISIHAPPRGATGGTIHRCIFVQFQFTPLREGRRSGDWQNDHQGKYFNSRPSARGDYLTIDYVSGIIPISIHAPPRGATVMLLARLPVS